MHRKLLHIPSSGQIPWPVLHHLEELVTWQLLPIVHNPPEVSLVKDGDGDVNVSAVLGDQEKRPMRDLVLALYNLAEDEV